MLAPSNLKKKPSIIFNNLKNAQEFQLSQQSKQSHVPDPKMISPLFSARVLFDFDSDGFDGAIACNTGDTVLVFGKEGEQGRGLETKDVRDQIYIRDGGWVQVLTAC
jgi:hypothetical protein